MISRVSVTVFGNKEIVLIKHVPAFLYPNNLYSILRIKRNSNPFKFKYVHF